MSDTIVSDEILVQGCDEVLQTLDKTEKISNSISDEVVNMGTTNHATGINEVSGTDKFDISKLSEDEIRMFYQIAVTMGLVSGDEESEDSEVSEDN